ncbi:hypothetical protein PpBr36_01316, partial [Pyricularia pennisetigena]|uniref:hypothetical protein n=1 Tax=Pyricularia pennisetigena TaxID=1578925 RepID=UPI0011508D0C
PNGDVVRAVGQRGRRGYCTRRIIGTQIGQQSSGVRGEVKGEKMKGSRDKCARGKQRNLWWAADAEKEVERCNGRRKTGK